MVRQVIGELSTEVWRGWGFQCVDPGAGAAREVDRSIPWVVEGRSRASVGTSRVGGSPVGFMLDSSGCFWVSRPVRNC